MYASKTPRDLNHDPYPYRIEVRTELLDPAERADYLAMREGERISDPAWRTFWDAEFELCVHDPRPEFDHVQHNAPNPILSAFRRDAEEMERERGWDTRTTTRSWDRDAFDPFVDMYPTGYLDHACRVLARLANLSQIGA